MISIHVQTCCHKSISYLLLIIPMKIICAVRLFLCIATLTAVGCTSGVRVKELSECRYGDDEVSFIETFGSGTKMIYFQLNGTEYHYRFFNYQYATKSDPGFGFLFNDGVLSRIVRDDFDDGIIHALTKDESTLFNKCVFLRSDIDWGGCLSSALQKMGLKDVMQTPPDFSNAIEHQEETIHGEPALYVLSLEAFFDVVLWPVTITMKPLNAANNKNAQSCIEDILERVHSIYSSDKNAAIIYALDQIQPNILETLEDSSLDNRRLVVKQWLCDTTQDGIFSITVRLGFIDGQVNWAFIKLTPETYEWELKL